MKQKTLMTIEWRKEQKNENHRIPYEKKEDIKEIHHNSFINTFRATIILMKLKLLKDLV